MQTALRRAKCSVFIATSLDGYIARPDGSVDWLIRMTNERCGVGDHCGFAGFMSTVDALVMGRRTFEQVVGACDWHYGRTPVVVMTRGSADRIHQLMNAQPEDRRLPPEASVSVSAGETPATLVDRLTAEGKRHLYIDGGVTIQSFLEALLVDEITITTIPILLGSGKPLFSSNAKEQMLEHVETKAYDFGFVKTKWRVVHPNEEAK